MKHSNVPTHACANLKAGVLPHARRGFLDTMRDSLSGREPRAQGSVPQVRSSAWTSGNAGPGVRASPLMRPHSRAGHGGSFLGTAAAAAVGVIGGGLLMNSLRSMFGGSHGMQNAFDPSADTGPSPWGGDASNSDLARDAGINDIGTTTHASTDDGSGAGLFGGDGDNDGFDNSDGGFGDSSDA